jgi:hypothetical protein
VAPATPWNCRGPGAKTAGGGVARIVLIAVLGWLAIWNCRVLTPLRRSAAFTEQRGAHKRAPRRPRRHPPGTPAPPSAVGYRVQKWCFYRAAGRPSSALDVPRAFPQNRRAQKLGFLRAQLAAERRSAAFAEQRGGAQACSQTSPAAFPKGLPRSRTFLSIL